MAAHCPRCGSSATRPSHRWRLQDLAALAIGMRACRCRSCYGRFYLSWLGGLRPLGLPVLHRPASRSLRRWWCESWRWRQRRGPLWARRLAVAGGLAFALSVFLFLITRETAASGLP
jgi:hypothetical protein